MKKIDNQSLKKITQFAGRHYNKVVVLVVIGALGATAYFCVNLLYSPQTRLIMTINCLKLPVIR